MKFVLTLLSIIAVANTMTTTNWAKCYTDKKCMSNGDSIKNVAAFLCIGTDTTTSQCKYMTTNPQ